MKKTVFKGIATALVTPLTPDGIDYDRFGKLLDWQVAEGIDGLVVCGTTGEASTLTDDEHKAAIKFAVERVNGRVPVIAGTGSNDTEYAIELTKYACSVGVDGVLLVTPYYNKATQNGLIKMFSTLADESTAPVILYNVPSRTGVNIQPKTLYELSKHPNISAVKEASGKIDQIEQIIKCKRDDFVVLSGDDGITIDVIRKGGDGVISVAVDAFPEKFCKAVNLAREGRFDEADKAYEPLNDAVCALFEQGNPVGVKAALAVKGLISNSLRLPLVPATDMLVRKLEKLITEYDLR